MDQLIALQREILTQASQYVKENGILVYSTCTICKKENQGNLNWFLDHFPFELCDIQPYVEAFTPEKNQKGWIQLFPHREDTDGFFIAKMRRKGSLS